MLPGTKRRSGLPNPLVSSIAVCADIVTRRRRLLRQPGTISRKEPARGGNKVVIDAELLAAVTSAVAVVLAAVIGLPRALRDAKDEVLELLQVYNALPEDSGARPRLLALIESKVDALTSSGEPTRDPTGISVATMFLLIGTGLAWSVYVYGSWWWWTSPIVLFFLVFGVVGLAQDLPRRARDGRGRPIRS